MQQTTEELLGLFDETAERQVLAAVTRSDKWLSAARGLNPAAFKEMNRIVMFEAVLDLNARNEAITADSVVGASRRIAMRRRLKNPNIVTRAMVAGAIAYELPAELDVVERIGQLSKLYKLRAHTASIDSIVQLIAQQPSIDEVRKAVVSLSTTLMAEDDGESKTILYGYELADLAAEVIAELDDQDNKRKHFRWPWPVSFADVTPPFRSNCVMFAGSDGTGKSSVAETLAEFWAENEGLQVGYCHTEYSKRFCVTRWLSSRSYMSMHRLERGNFSRYDRQKLDEVGRQLPVNLHFIEGGGRTIGEIIADAYVLKQEGRLDALFLDYFSDHDVTTGPYSRDNETQKLTSDMRRFHAALADLDIVGVVLAQGNKDLIGMPVKDLNRSKIGLPAGVLRKMQTNILLAPRILTYDLQDEFFVEENGVPQLKRCGKAGSYSMYVPFVVDKANNSPRVETILVRGENFRFSEPNPLMIPWLSTREGEAK